MLKKVRDYIEDNEFRLTLFTNRVHIINYKEILSLEEKRISLITENKRIVLKGEKLLLHKLLEKEVLINGNIKTIEVEDYGK